MDWFLRGEAFFYWGMLVQRQSYCGDYACPHGGVTVSVSDGTDSSTQVTAARGVWVHVVLSYHVRHSMLSPFVGLALLTFPGAESLRVWLLGPGTLPTGLRGGS
jgi:hypothetical protein